MAEKKSENEDNLSITWMYIWDTVYVCIPTQQVI